MLLRQRTCCGTTLRGKQVRLRLPPQAAPAEGRPKARPRRPVNRAKRTTRRGPHHSPAGGQKGVGLMLEATVRGGSGRNELISYQLVGNEGRLTRQMLGRVTSRCVV
jgi:hypothetical protein